MFSENNMKENMTVATFLLRNISNNIFESWLRSTDYKIAVWYPFSGRSMIFFQLAEHMKAIFSFFRTRNKTARNFDWRWALSIFKISSLLENSGIGQLTWLVQRYCSRKNWKTIVDSE